jgi:hypothetical protein
VQEINITKQSAVIDSLQLEDGFSNASNELI